jgi:hypothetical protein
MKVSLRRRVILKYLGTAQYILCTECLTDVETYEVPLLAYDMYSLFGVPSLQPAQH